MKTQLCSVEELISGMSQQSFIVLDGSWYLPTQNINARHEYEQRHIPGAQFFDIDLISDQDSSLPHMLPSAEQFSNEVSNLGISNESPIVVYDSAGLFSAARVWWTFKVFGHTNVQVLEGGLPAWLEEGGALENNLQAAKKTNYVARLNNQLVVDKASLIENLSSKRHLVLGARSKERFLGTAPEPRPDLPPGHMPESTSFSFGDLIVQGRLKPREELERLFSEAKVNSASSIITTCGSGLTAAIISLALVECGYGLNRLYDGSWSEWAAANDTPIRNKSH